MKKRWSFKKNFKEILVTLMLFFIVSQLLNFIRKPDITENIYDYTLKDIENQKIDFSSYKGQPLVVHFWGSWCPVCRAEASNIDTLSQKYNLITIAVNSGSNEAIKSYMEEHGLHYRVINDQKGEMAQWFNIGGYPTTLIYNAKGELKFTEVGYSTTLGLQARIELIK